VKDQPQQDIKAKHHQYSNLSTLTTTIIINAKIALPHAPFQIGFI
jgi:hypothetical protein